ncbi:MAG TPA: glucoamylase family protein [Mobilitalea sp.]|nr:glucoamylase family protein [Mobilitalea sp.]
MLGTTEGIGFYIESNIGIGVLIILIILTLSILWYLYYRFIYFRKRARFYRNSEYEKEMLEPKEWESQMSALAEEHVDAKRKHFNFVLEDSNQIAYRRLNKIRNNISDVPTDIISLIPAARWLFDNFQILYREIKKTRTSGTSYEILPIIKNKHYHGYPRVYIVAKKMVALSGGHLSEDTISIMINAYQESMPLTDKELWVLPEMIGFCLLESVIEVAEDIIKIVKCKSKADRFVKDKLAPWQGLREGVRPEIPLVSGDISLLLSDVDAKHKDNCAFHSHVIYLLKNMSFDDMAVQRYLDYQNKSGTQQLKPSQVFLEEGKLESHLELSIRALIISLREVNETDDENFFEKYSCLEKILSKDPEQIYSRMDPESRGMYRGIIVKLAHKTGAKEELIAQECLALTAKNREDLNQAHHVGAYLLGRGYKALEAKVRNRTITVNLKKKKNFKGFAYFFTLSIILIAICCTFKYIMVSQGEIQGLVPIIITLIIALPIFIGIALEITNHIFTRRIMVTKLPSLDFNQGIPEHARTFIVMPVIVSSKEQGEEYLDRLLKHYLANRQSNLYFALLVDYEDSPEQKMKKDAVIEEALIQHLTELNLSYPNEHQRFCLFVRERKWNPSEQCYMCWERKRGKLEEFNQLLYGEGKDNTSFVTQICDRELLNTFKYVITLDADSNLLRDNAAKLVGLIDHPLNQPVLDATTGRVKEGYVIIQPAVRNHIANQKDSSFTEIFGGQSGLAHYSSVISDIYQDIFNQGIYIGKGIYHIEAFHKTLHNKLPENRVLSHDLLESCYARTAFSSAAQIMDRFPSSVISYGKREHRWIRGDWQLLPWLWKKKAFNGKPLCSLSKWKIFDNLRRSMVPLCKIILIIANLAWMPKASYLWIPVVFFSDFLNLVILLIAIISQKLYRPKLVIVYKGLLRELRIMTLRAYLELVLTPYRAYISSDASIRTIYRLFISRKNLLRWNASEAVDKSIINTRKGYFLTMWGSLLPTAVLLLLLLFVEVDLVGVVIYGALILIWALAFLMAYRMSQPREEKLPLELKEEKELLIETARRTWQFFQKFASQNSNWLCPDNYQIDYKVKISDKTSPTNIGLQFLAILTARDLGFLTLSLTISKVENLLDTVLKLPKWKGHLYNWYNIKTLEVLSPEYISTVDSGNFLGDLIALKNGLLEQINQPVFTKHLIKELQVSISRSNTKNLKWGENISIGEVITDITDLWENLSCNEAQPEKKAIPCRDLMRNIEEIVKEATDFQLRDNILSSCPTINQLKESGNKSATLMIEKIKEITKKIDAMLEQVDFKFLFNEKRMLFHIGYHVASQSMDMGCYDLMASEAALTSLIAIAKGEVPLKHWYKLGRPLTLIKGIPCFVSWSGTMFEYLMPSLVLKEYEGSVFSESYKAAVLQHMKYAKQMEIPWGISESQYYRFDLNSNYQYRAFGVPKLRLQPVRRNPLVVAPYATMLALEHSGVNGLSNLNKLAELGGFGEYGFYEAIDFTGPDAKTMAPYCIVKSFMAHHQGMSLVAIDNFLNQGIMRNRFHREPMVKATEVLLEEKRQSHLISTAKRGYTIYIGKLHPKEEVYNNRYVNSTTPEIPVAGYMSNNNYSLMITSDGDGFSRYSNIEIYRWRADLYANTGNYIYIKDISQGKLWSATYHPTRTEPKEYKVVFSPHSAEFTRLDGDISSHTVVSLSPSHNFEIRKLSLTNRGKKAKNLEITSYLEVVGDSHLAELSHPAFNKLFIESEFIEEQSIFLSRRRNSKGVANPYLCHMVKTGMKTTCKVEYENDRLRFLGRNNTPENPEVVINSISLSNRSGFCNDPIMSLRVNISLEAGETTWISFITGVCDTKEDAIGIGKELSAAYRIDEIMESFRLQTEIELKYLEITREQLSAFQNLIIPIFYPSAIYRGPRQNIRRNVKNQSFLWKFGVSGDNPIFLLRIESIDEAEMIKEVLKCYEYMRINRVEVDLIILSEAKHGYMQELDDLIHDMTSSLKIYDIEGAKPSLFLLHSYQMIPAELDLLYTVARVVFTDKTGIYFRNIKGLK